MVRTTSQQLLGSLRDKRFYQVNDYFVFFKVPATAKYIMPQAYINYYSILARKQESRTVTTHKETARCRSCSFWFKRIGLNVL